jgi:hypothetical protein
MDVIAHDDECNNFDGIKALCNRQRAPEDELHKRCADERQPLLDP